MARSVSMPAQKPSHGIFIKWGRLEIGVFGIPAVIAVLGAAIAGLVGRLGGVW
jgi:hypothetical protein